MLPEDCTAVDITVQIRATSPEALFDILIHMSDMATTRHPPAPSCLLFDAVRLHQKYK
jgi:hypothetical protein